MHWQECSKVFDSGFNEDYIVAPEDKRLCHALPTTDHSFPNRAANVHPAAVIDVVFCLRSGTRIFAS